MKHEMEIGIIYIQLFPLRVTVHQRAVIKGDCNSSYPLWYLLLQNGEQPKLYSVLQM